MYFTGTRSKERVILEGMAQCITQLAAIDIKVIAIICDQEAVHQKIYRQHKQQDGTINIGGVAASFIYDVPHLLKSTRNCILSKKIEVSLNA